MDRLRQILRNIDGQGYKAYKQLNGSYRFPDYELVFDHVQGDPFAAPSRICIRRSHAQAGFPAHYWENASRRDGFEDFLARTVARACAHHVRGRRGSGNSGLIGITVNRQTLLRRNALVTSADGIEARMLLGLPADGRRVAAAAAETMLFTELPAVVAHSLRLAAVDGEALWQHICSCENQHFLRAWLSKEQLVAFIADGAMLARRSGVDDRPLQDQAIAFTAPPSLRRSITPPHGGTISGMGVPEGVTLIVGGGFHGKSTLLHALERGVYNHIPGDGREQVVTVADAMKIRAEDGRAVRDVDISGFIDNLPLQRDTRRFTTENASGSTSQAANIIEALETGCRCLLIDEDTSASNFMIRDERMQQLVAADKEPITPLLHRVRALHREQGVSSVIVMGGSGDYLDVADQVIMLDNYRALDVSAQARALRRPQASWQDTLPPLMLPAKRRLAAAQLQARRQDGKLKIDARDNMTLVYGECHIDLSRVEQLLESGQSKAIGHVLQRYLQHYQTAADTVTGIRQVLREIAEHGLDVLCESRNGALALPRLQEIMAAANRLRRH